MKLNNTRHTQEEVKRFLEQKINGWFEVARSYLVNGKFIDIEVVEEDKDYSTYKIRVLENGILLNLYVTDIYGDYTLLDLYNIWMEAMVEAPKDIEIIEI